MLARTGRRFTNVAQLFSLIRRLMHRRSMYHPPMGKRPLSSELLPGTLEMLVLKTISRGEAHGYAIARHLEQVSGDVLQVGESSLYPALQRLLVNGWVKAEWGETSNGRRARFYRITPAGRKRLAEESAGFERLVAAIAAVMQEG